MNAPSAAQFVPATHSLTKLRSAAAHCEGCDLFRRATQRLHAKPSAREISARPWLDAEIEAVEPKVIVLLGATAAQSFLGPKFRITRQRGQWLDHDGISQSLIATYHPSAILRAPDPESRHRLREEFTADMKLVAKRLKALVG